MDDYLFDDVGRIQKQWWHCLECDVNYHQYVEVCPCCKQDNTVSLGMKDPGDNYLMKMRKEKMWCRLKHSRVFQFAWETEPIRPYE